ncbi:hypothetical protein AB0M64_31970 [Streptomyces sp. NPDC051771]|uniref:hypothetical protein n=1 Tax=Streptomyces sp. NPDC051771 TaxID=3154847 RepID=UPI0034135CFD
MTKTGGSNTRFLIGAAVYTAVGLGAAVALGFLPATETSDRAPSGVSASVPAESAPAATPAVTTTPTPVTPTPTPTPTPAAVTTAVTEPPFTPTTSAPERGAHATGGLQRDGRANDDYYDGDYDNDDDWHREYGDPDEYYDGNYDNDDDYHRKYGRD